MFLCKSYYVVNSYVFVRVATQSVKGDVKVYLFNTQNILLKANVIGKLIIIRDVNAETLW